MPTLPLTENSAAERTAPEPGRRRWLAPILLANLVAEVAIVVTGGIVRTTSSGLGCPTWPECTEGSIAPTPEQAEGFHKYIEFGNRLLTFVLVILAAATVLAVLAWARRRPMIVAAAAVVLGVVAQAVVGGLSVIYGLNPLAVSAHFLISMLLIVASSYLWFARDYGDAPRVRIVPTLVVRLAWVTTAVGAAVLVLGTLVTGSGPHSGDADTPARYPFEVRSIAWLHADVVMLFLGLVVATWVAVRLSGHTRNPARAWAWVLAVSLAQGVGGYAQYFTGVPAAAVVVHMLGASLLVVALTGALLSLRTAARP